MTTDIMDVVEAVAEKADEPVDEKTELEMLLEVTKNKITRGDQTPCAACGILVQIKASTCPHCESNIMANNALLRESMRRIAEIRGEIDGQHGDVVRRDKMTRSKRGFWARLFSGAGSDDGSNANNRDDHGPRILDTTAEGDQLKVVAYDGPWFKVKTRDGRIGWVYSTLRIDS